ncbi:hypothetical protein SAMN06272771_6421 [Streptomyces sp. Ag82_O1-12]|nr:hypothetical protein SAMN06272771_6421 [Streptomyces sp. Ag82_O1-12]SOD48964.1 hypothetical protein SAMN06272727_6425 [Streptomyces sp. Ag82_G6-1]
MTRWTTLLVHKHQRDVASQWREARHELCAGSLPVLTQAHSELEHLSDSGALVREGG